MLRTSVTLRDRSADGPRVRRADERPFQRLHVGLDPVDGGQQRLSSRWGDRLLRLPRPQRPLDPGHLLGRLYANNVVATTMQQAFGMAPSPNPMGPERNRLSISMPPA